MNQALTKEQVERRVFERLALLAGYQVVPNSIKQPPPPAPDIECHVEGVGALAVELLALDHESTRTRLSNMSSTKTAWDRALATRPQDEQSRLRAECEDLFLSLNFDECTGSRLRRDTMLAIHARLLVLGPTFIGSLFADGTEPSGLRDAIAYRGHVADGPQLSASSVGSWLPPQLNKIQEKLTSKRYSTVAPLELFAYAMHDEPDGAVGLLDRIDRCVRTHLPCSQFQRVHVFHAGFGEVIYRHP